MLIEINFKIYDVLLYIKMKDFYENIRRLNYLKLEIFIYIEIFDSVWKFISLLCLVKIIVCENSN